MLETVLAINNPFSMHLISNYQTSENIVLYLVYLIDELSEIWEKCTFWWPSCTLKAKTDGSIIKNKRLMTSNEWIIFAWEL